MGFDIGSALDGQINLSSDYSSFLLAEANLANRTSV
jgi:hypothetical protein